ncbi:MAG: DUF4080 domain-containing protein [Clostridia bacterium]|nr:DUF4080 domain-containing protein [Clostridia bacterium]
MKITLFALNSSYTHTNLAIRYLAYSLNENNIHAELKEFCLKDKHENILCELYRTNSDIYAFSVYIWNYTEMIELARELKCLLPDSKIIFGGPEVSFENESFFEKFPFVDTVICGQGEEVITDVCTNISSFSHKCVTGTCSKDFFRNSPILYDTYPAKGDILYYESSRGCPHRCSYCLSSLTQGVYAKTAEKTLKDLLEFEKLPQKPRIIKFIDRTFNFDLKRAKTIWKELCTEKYTLNYHFEICADQLDEECFDILKNMLKGKIQFEAGIQSCNPKTLKAINRNTDNKKAIENLKRIKDYKNIHIHADLIAALPYEDMPSLKYSFDETIGCCDKLQLGFLKMLKGSHIRENPKTHGYIYSSKPPYQVIQNNYINFDEMFTLIKIADVIDRIYSSERFEYTCEYILKNAKSPFEFFEGFTRILKKDIEKISQNDLRLLLFDYLKECFSASEAIERLALDTLIWENKSPPAVLCEYYTEHGKEKEFDLYSFDFAKEKKYYINRTKHIVIIK